MKESHLDEYVSEVDVVQQARVEDVVGAHGGHGQLQRRENGHAWRPHDEHRRRAARAGPRPLGRVHGNEGEELDHELGRGARADQTAHRLAREGLCSDQAGQSARGHAEISKEG